MQPSLFTKIINGEIPCQKIHETDTVLAFLDINPITPGHTLVVPKRQVDHLWDLDQALYDDVMHVTKQVGARIREVMQPVRVGMILEGFQIPHAHVHVYPLYEGMPETFEPYFERLRAGVTVSQNELEAIAKTLAF